MSAFRDWLEVSETALARVYTLGAGIVVLLATSRVLGPENQGLLAAILAWIALISQLSGLSLGQIIHNQYQSSALSPQRYVNQAANSLVLFSLLLSSIAAAVAIVLFKVTGGELFRGIALPLLLAALLLVPFLILEEYLRNLLAIAGLLRRFNMALVIGRSVWIVGTGVVLFGMQGGVLEIILANFVGQMLVVVISLYYLLRNIPYTFNVSIKEAYLLCKGGLKLHLNSVGAYILVHNGVLILNYYTEKEFVAWYQIAFQLVMLLAIFPQSASTVLYAKMSKLGVFRLWDEQKRFVFLALLLTCFAGLVSYFVMPIIVRIVLGQAYEPVIKIFQYLLPMLLGISLAQIMAPQWIGRGLFLQTSLITMVTAMLSILSNLILVPMYGVWGVVWTALIGLGLITILVQVFFAHWCTSQNKKMAGSL